MSEIPEATSPGEMSGSRDLAAAPPIQALHLAPPPPRVLSPRQQALNQRFSIRVWCTFTFALCAAMLSVGLWLTPSDKGMGTHEQMGLPPCGFLATTGFPCPTCGCTTAVSHFAHGQFAASFIAQPFGFLVGLIAALLLPLTLVGVASGRWLGPSMFTLGWYWRTWLYGGIAILLLAWLYKVIMVRAGA